MPMGEWPFHKICWVAVGKGSLESEQKTFSIGASDFLILPAKWRHRFVDLSKAPLTLVILCISVDYLETSLKSQLSLLWRKSLGDESWGQPRCARTAFHLSALVENFRLALQEEQNRSFGWETALKTVANRLLLNLSRGHCEVRESYETSSTKSVQGAVEFIDSHLYESLQVSDVAERCGLSPRRFTDLFKEVTGKTFSQYLNEKRIAYACRRLDETGHILYACHESGFNDAAYFYRVFKKHTGQTPGEYVASR